MSKYHDHRSDCPFKFASLDVCDCVEHNMLDRIEALTAKVKLMDDLDVINGEKIEALTAKLAKAVEALREVAGECGCSTARATLAEIEGSNAP
jgi:hypothetical protein